MQVTLASTIVRPDNAYPQTTFTFNAPQLSGLDDGVKFHRIGEIAVEVRQTLINAHEQYMSRLADNIHDEIETLLAAANDNEPDSNQKLLRILDGLIAEKQAQLDHANRVVQGYYPFDPVTAPNADIYRAFLGRAGASFTSAKLKALTDALHAAFHAVALSQALILLRARVQSVNAAIQAVQPANIPTPSIAAVPVVVTATGSIIATLSQVPLAPAIGAALTRLGSFLASTASGLFVGVFALLYPSRLGNSDLPAHYVLQAPLAQLDPQLAAALASSGSATTPVELPFRFGSKAGENGGAEIFAATTDGQVVPSQVRVLGATYDVQSNVYTATTADIPPRTLTWTPVVTPGDASTSTPVEPVEAPVYEGATLTLVEARIDGYPALGEVSWDDYVIVFPADSGLPPLYVVFNSPYPGATTRGIFSGRMYNPGKAGGPILHLDWRTATITRAGIDLIRLHTSRFGFSDGNAIMIERLEKILTGEISVSDTDLRFYTHEVRELERFRELGIKDGVKPDDDGEAWNNTHAATLEDYRLSSDLAQLYTTEAIEADDLQTEREEK